VKTNENIKCWFCHRTAKEVVEEGVKLALDPIYSSSYEDALTLAIEKISIFGTITVNVCIICSWTMGEIALKNFNDNLDAGNLDVITKDDLKDITFKVKVSEK